MRSRQWSRLDATTKKRPWDIRGATERGATERGDGYLGRS
jgi:hypothetical protein